MDSGKPVKLIGFFIVQKIVEQSKKIQSLQYA